MNHLLISFPEVYYMGDERLHLVFPGCNFIKINYNFYAKLNICILAYKFNFLQKIKEIDRMSFIHDFIMESNQLEDLVLYEQKNRVDKKKPIKKKVEAQEPIDENCGKEEPKQEKPIKEEIVEEKELSEEYVNIEDYLPPEAYVTSMEESLQEQAPAPTKAEQRAEERRKKREKKYRELSNIDEDFEITEEHINKNKWALDWASMWGATNPEKLKSELLHRPYEMKKDDSEE